MHTQTLDGNQALAQGALAAGVEIVTGYPGSPSSKTMVHLIKIAEEGRTYAEWAVNEKVALEMAIGASISGARALVCLKSVGMNIAVDPLMVINLTGVKAGLVILLGDDPGAYLSQNEQDTRYIAQAAEVPLMEPATPAEGAAMMQAAFELSETYAIPVVVRETRAFSLRSEKVAIPPPTRRPKRKRSFPKQSYRWISTSVNAIENHRRLHEKGTQIAQTFNTSPFNRREGTGNHGVIATGVTYTKLMEALGHTIPEDLSVLKLGTIYPLPSTLGTDFLRSVEKALVLEENDPYVETWTKAMAYQAGLRVPILGKLTGHVIREGDLNGAQIREALSKLLGRPLSASGQGEGIGKLDSQRSLCEDCPYIPMFQALKAAKEKAGVEVVITGDPGCIVRAALPPIEMLDVKYAMGNSIGLAMGIARAGVQERAVALVGDSSFFHSAVGGLMDAVHHQSDVLVIVLDNGSAALTGFQPHPGSGRDSLGREAPQILVEDFARACGIHFVHVVDPDDIEHTQQVFREGLLAQGVRLIVSRKPCPRQA